MRLAYSRSNLADPTYEGIFHGQRIAGTEVDIHSGADEETVGMVLRLLESC